MGTLVTFLTPPAGQNVHVQVSSEISKNGISNFWKLQFLVNIVFFTVMFLEQSLQKHKIEIKMSTCF